MSVWAKTRWVFRRNEWHRKGKANCEGWVGSQHTRRIFSSHSVPPWSVPLHVIPVAVYVRKSVRVPGFFLLSELIGSNLADHVDCTVASIAFSRANCL